jgi:DNA-binding CsgD family transcriptional regulator
LVIVLADSPLACIRCARRAFDLVSEGLGNNDIATRLFVSPRKFAAAASERVAVQSHLTHVYTKLGLTSRVQLVQEAARHS